MGQASSKVEGIVIRTLDYGEADRIVGFLTPDHGKLSGFAASARKSQKRYGGGLDLFAHLELDVTPPSRTQSHLWRIRSVHLLEPFFSIRADLRRMAIACYLAECLWALAAEGDPQAGLYAWWLKTLQHLDGDAVEQLSEVRLDLEMLALCGYAPRWSTCTECGRAPSGERTFFSFERGGVSCSTCQKKGEGRWIENRWVETLKGEQDRAARDGMRQTLNAFVSYTLGKEPKSQQFREEALGGSSGSV